MKSGQCIKAEIQARNIKQWVLKTILWRHYYSIKGLEKAILKDFQPNMGNIQCHTTLTLPLPYPHQILIYIGVLDLWVSFILNWISWIVSELWQGKHLDLIKQGPISYSEQLFWVGRACYSVVDKNASKKILIMKVTR